MLQTGKISNARSWNSCQLLVDDRAVFKWVSKEMLCLLWFCFISLSDWIKSSRHILNQSEVKPKLIVTCSHAFCRAWHYWLVFALIGPFCFVFLFMLWLVRVITLPLVLRHSFGNRSIKYTMYYSGVVGDGSGWRNFHLFEVRLFQTCV